MAPYFFYEKMPPIVQSVFVSAYGFFKSRNRFGKQFEKMFYEYQVRDYCSESECRAYRKKMLADFLRHSVNSVFWKKRFEIYGVDIYSDPETEISKLPILTKAEVRTNLADISIPLHGSSRRSTSGSTGAGLVFWGNRRSDAEQWAVWWRYWSRFGIERGMWCAHFGGKAVVPIKSKKPPYYRVNYFSKQVMFSSYHLSNDTIAEYVDVLNKRKIKWLHGYASTISELARLALSQGLNLQYKVDFISLGSENVTSAHERVIEQFFGVKPIQHYGLAEGVANFSQLPGSEGFVVDEDFSYVEFIPHGDAFQIVGTNFTNFSFPLIRYDTSDLAVGVNLESFPRTVRELDGRKDDVIALPDGRRIGRLALVFHTFIEVDEVQVVQKSLEKILIKVVKNSEWKEDTEVKILAALRSKLGSDIEIEFEYVLSVPRTASGKIRFVVSEIER